MKGPFERLKYDLRRMWECPLCHRRERTDGTATTRMCSCAVKGGGTTVAMKLVEDGPRRVDGLALPKRIPSLPTVAQDFDSMPPTA